MVAAALVEVHVDPLQLQLLDVAAHLLVHAGGVDAVLVTDDFPELWRRGGGRYMEGRDVGHFVRRQRSRVSEELRAFPGYFDEPSSVP